MQYMPPSYHMLFSIFHVIVCHIMPKHVSLDSYGQLSIKSGEWKEGGGGVKYVYLGDS